MSVSEKELVERVLSGDSSAFEPLVAPYRRLLLGFAYRLARNSEDAKEIAQDALLRSFKYLRNFDTGKSFKSWLMKILIHSARNHLKARSRRDDILKSDPVRDAASRTPAGPEYGHERRELRGRLLDCLDALTPREREVFLLRDIEDLSIAESARILGCSAISVRVHLSAARKKIRETIRIRYPGLLEGPR